MEGLEGGKERGKGCSYILISTHKKLFKGLVFL